MTTASFGLFDSQCDIGDVGEPGDASLVDGIYRVSGSGQNMWFGVDAFHFVWTKHEGDIALTADISFPESGVDPHRKACLVIRESLDDDSAYAGIALHGDGLVSLQFRAEKGARTQEVQANTTGPARFGIERRGAHVSATIDGRPSGGSVRLDLGSEDSADNSGAGSTDTDTNTDPASFYIGLGVCAHQRGIVETAHFADVRIEPVVSTGRLVSTIETIDVASTDRRVVQVFDGHVEAPNWAPGDRLVYNAGGRLFTIPVGGGTSTPIDTGSAIACNNDHGLSPDGTLIAYSDQSEDDGRSVIFISPLNGDGDGATGEKPKRITANSPSYWHGWSPDGSTLAFCGERDKRFGIFTIPAEGGDETRLTTATVLDDGPDYSPDGGSIYFNSDRTGTMQLYGMNADGSGIQRLTDDGHCDWFPHPSPDGRYVAFLSYDGDVEGHPADHDVRLRMLDLHSNEIATVARLFGGQGTINVPSWSPDSARLAFVSYQYR